MEIPNIKLTYYNMNICLNDEKTIIHNLRTETLEELTSKFLVYANSIGYIYQTEVEGAFGSYGYMNDFGDTMIMLKKR